MSSERPVYVCNNKATDMAGEIVAALSAASIVFREEDDYAAELIKAAEEVYEFATKNDSTHAQGTYTELTSCGGDARTYYNSTGYIDELVWGGTWLSFATGNNSYLEYATEIFKAAEEEEVISDRGIFSWNNKLTAIVVILYRIS